MTSAAPKVSIIVPIYNVERYLSTCLTSLVTQTLHDVEIICVNDGSTDASASILHEYSARDPRIIPLKHIENRGLSAARNTGMSVARAPYIMFCDSDDYFSPRMCEKMLQGIESAPDCDLAICGTHCHYETAHEHEISDARYYAIRFSGLVNSCEHVFEKCNAAVWNKIFKREIVENHAISFPEGVRFEDAYFYNAYIVHTRRIHFTTESLYHYRRRNGSIMDEAFKGLADYNEDHLRVGELVCEYLKKCHLLEKFLHYFGKVFFSLIQSAVRGSDGTPAAVNSIYEHAEQILCSARIDFSPYPDISFARQLLQAKIRPGSVRSKCLGLFRTKVKQYGMKHYFCGIPYGKSSQI